MAGESDYFWNANDTHTAVEKGAGAEFSTGRVIQGADGYGGTNYEFSAQLLVVHVHVKAGTRQVKIVRIKTCNGASYDENIIKIRPSVSSGVNLKKLAYYCKSGFPNHAAFLNKLHSAMPTGR